MAWAYAKLALLDQPLIDAISGAAIARISQLSALSLSRTAWAFATLLIENEPLM